MVGGDHDEAVKIENARTTTDEDLINKMGLSDSLTIKEIEVH